VVGAAVWLYLRELRSPAPQPAAGEPPGDEAEGVSQSLRAPDD
jgi:hypothetical protein